MRNIHAAVALTVMATLAGCDKGTSGGPGAANPPAKEKMAIGQAEDTFRLAISNTELHQGEMKTIAVGINRGKNFAEDVTLKFNNLPKGVTVDQVSPVIKAGDMEGQIAFKVAADAALGDFTYTVSGHPTRGADATAEAKLSVAKLSPEEMAKAAEDAAKVKADEYTDSMQKQLDQLTVRYEDLETRASKAEGQAKTDLDIKVVESKAKLDVAVNKLDELESTSVDRWEAVKAEVIVAFEELRKSFA